MCRPSGAWCSARMRSHRSRGGLRSFVPDGTGQRVPQLGKARGKRANRPAGQLPNLASSRGDLKKQEADEVGGLFLEQEPRTPPLKEKGCQGNGAPIRYLNSKLIYGNDTISSCD